MARNGFLLPACAWIVCLLLSLLVSLLPSVYLADFRWPQVELPQLGVVTPLQRRLAIIIRPPNFVATTLGLQHLEFIHALEAPTAGSPPHDMTGCPCSPAEMRNAFLLVGWPFWFIVFLAAASMVSLVRERLKDKLRPNSR